MESIYGINYGARLFRQKTALSTPIGRSGLSENRGAFFPRQKQPWARPLDVQGFQKIKGLFNQENNSLEHARWLFRASRKLKGQFPENEHTLSTTFMLRFILFGWCLRVSFRYALSPPSNPPTPSPTHVKNALQLTRSRSFFVSP